MNFLSGRIPNQLGFTLVELVLVMTLVGILASMSLVFVYKPIEGFLGAERRGELVDTAETVLSRMQRDVRRGLPNSIRITSGGAALEFISTSDGGRYRAAPPGDILDMTTADSGFDVLGSLRAAPPAGRELAVYNLAPSGNVGNAYVGDNRAVIGNGSSVDHIVLNPAFLFPLASPYQRFFVLDGPVSYVFHSASGTLVRHHNYGYNVVQSIVFPSGNGDLIAENVASCQFSYAPGTSQRVGLLTIELAMTKGGERITLLHQVHVSSAP
ncbi:MAG: type II secretion system protein [Deltaproteobacteria bacterium]|nr:type II secretion system protein [Deltaproteobacteria bacterium]